MKKLLFSLLILLFSFSLVQGQSYYAPGSASSTLPGTVELSTDAETIAGSSTTVAVTPSTLKAKLGTQTDGAVLVGAGTSAAIEALPVGLTTEILVGGGAGTNPVWTTATGTGAPARAGSPVFTTQITTPAVVSLGNAASFYTNIPVTGTDATLHTSSHTIDGNAYIYATATGDGAGDVGANTIGLGVSGNADIVHIGDANALVDITDAHWSVTDAGVLSITSFGANWTNAGRTVADAGILTTADINGGTIDGTTVGATTPLAGTFTTLVGNKPAKTVSSTPVTLTIGELRNGIVFITTGASIVTLPDAGATYDGACVTFRDFTGVAFSINPDDSDAIDLNGTALDAGDKITSSGVAGEEVTLVWDNTGTKWRTIQMNGVFIDGGA